MSGFTSTCRSRTSSRFSDVTSTLRYTTGYSWRIISPSYSFWTTCTIPASCPNIRKTVIRSRFVTRLWRIKWQWNVLNLSCSVQIQCILVEWTSIHIRLKRLFSFCKIVPSFLSHIMHTPFFLLMLLSLLVVILLRFFRVL